MKRWILSALLVALAFSETVTAGPINNASVFNWTGFYVGAHAGYGISEDRAGAQISGPFGGLQIGHNSQFSNIVVGVEADLSAFWLENRFARINYFGTVRGRVGLAIDRVLLFATAGFAFSDVENDFTGLNSPATGLVTGVGVEWMFAQQWSMKFEYLVADLDIRDGGAIDVSTFRFGANYRF